MHTLLPLGASSLSFHSRQMGTAAPAGTFWGLWRGDLNTRERPGPGGHLLSFLPGWALDSAGFMAPGFTPQLIYLPACHLHCHTFAQTYSSLEGLSYSIDPPLQPTGSPVGPKPELGHFPTQPDLFITCVSPP